MRDVTGSTLIARLDLPTKDMMMSKAEAFVSDQNNIHHADDNGFDTASDSTSIGPEHDILDTSGGADADQSLIQKENKDIAMPMTPECAKMNETSTPETAKTVETSTPESVKTVEVNTPESANMVEARTPENKKPNGAGKATVVVDRDDANQEKEELQNMEIGEVRSHRKRILSLDRATEKDGHNSPACIQEMENNRKEDNNRRTRRHHSHSRSRRHHDDADSSDDDDSYFARNLPDPKSGRSFSISSTGSAPAPAPNAFYDNNASRESDASLSFSDESDDDHVHRPPGAPGVHVSPMIPPKGGVADMHLYPQRITRMHSVSSLVSSGSDDEASDGRPQLSAKTSASSVTTSSDPDVRAELHEMAIAAQAMAVGHNMNDPSGRRSPVMGHNAFFYGESPTGPINSPPPIAQGYASSPGVAHPQALTRDQMDSWAAGGNPASHHFFPEGHLMYEYGSPFAPEQRSIVSSDDTGFRLTSDQSNFTLTLAYSEDNDTEDELLVNQMANGIPSGGNHLFNGSGPGSSGPPGSQQNPYQSGNSYVGSNGQGNIGMNGGGSNAQTHPSAGKFALDSKDNDVGSEGSDDGTGGSFKIYWQRWIMLMYMSLLNLLSDWTCYSVAPIALLTEQAFGDIDPEKLVVIFLAANAFASACEPIILARLGLRRTVLFGALFLMIGSIVKSGGVPPIIETDLEFGHSEWRLYLGFFLVGLSQPLYQCTPALLSCSWFPETERTMATGVALNANQLGIGFAFIFGTLLVETAEDIPGYFGLLSTISTIAFLGTLIQFDDAPPTPPSSSAKVMKGDVVLPSVNTMVQSVRDSIRGGPGVFTSAPSPAPDDTVKLKSGKKSSKKGSARRRTATKKPKAGSDLLAPSPMMPGRVGQEGTPDNPDESPLYSDVQQGPDQLNQPPPDASQPATQAGYPVPPGHPYPGMPADAGSVTGAAGPPGLQYPVPPFGSMPHPQYQIPYWDPRMQQQMQQQQAYYQQQYYFYLQQQQQQPPQQQEQQPGGQMAQVPPPFYYPYSYPQPMQFPGLPPEDDLDYGAEPIVTVTDHRLDINIRDDQVIRSIRACLVRPGFIHCLVSFTVSGIVINTLSTYMDYLVRLGGAPRSYTGIVGGAFQFIIMISSLIIGKQTDKTRAYYSVTIGMLVVGAFGLAECGVSLDADRGSDLRWSLLVVAALVGPLQPVSTELGVEVAYPLSENTVLVIQQLFSNLLSALFIPVFKALKDVGAETVDETVERPEYTFSFYLLIVLHTGATIFFATFNGKYLRYEHELEKQAAEERKAMESEGAAGESTPLLNNPVV